jgi:hypothetical protein
MSAEYFYVSPNWSKATGDLPRKAEALLMDLVGQAACQRSPTLLIEVPFLESLRSSVVERRNVHHLFDLLLERGFVREVEESRYLIAPGLWAFADDIDNLKTSAKRTAD